MHVCVGVTPDNVCDVLENNTVQGFIQDFSLGGGGGGGGGGG